jgi:hypothetical protein
VQRIPPAVLDDILMPARVISTAASGRGSIMHHMTVSRLNSLNQWITVRWRERALTRSLADGADPAADERLTLRARALTARRERSRIACGIEHLVADAEDRHLYWSSAAPFDAAAVHDARRDLETLAAELRSRDAVSARGVALAELLLIDYDSPLYGGAKADGLPEAARRAVEALR